MDKIMLEEVSPTITHSVPVSIYKQENEKNGNRELSFPKSRDRKMFLYIFFSLETETTDSWRMLTNGG